MLGAPLLAQKESTVRLTDLSWIAGHWQGEALRGTVQEIWSTPIGESMMGSFKSVKGGKVNFYELMTICEEEGTLVLRIKHFDRQLKGWEEKEKSVEFPFLRLEKNKVVFDGLIFERINKKRMNVHVQVEADQELTFEYSKKRL